MQSLHCPQKTCFGEHERGKAIILSMGTILQHNVGNPPLYKQMIFVILVRTYILIKIPSIPSGGLKKTIKMLRKEKAHLDLLHEDKD